MTPQQTLQALTRRQNLSAADMHALMTHLMNGEVAPSLMGALLAALRTKTESIEEIAAAARTLRQFATPIPLSPVPHLVETAGTGGDALNTFNISTAASIVAAAGGSHVAKHCGRAISSSSGSGDVLEALGLSLSNDPKRIATSIEKFGVGFIFAPHFHSATRHIAPVRRELGIRTLFNLLGPLTNPTAAPHQVTGVWQKELVAQQAQVLALLGLRHAIVMHGDDGLDEISINTHTHIAELKDGAIHEFVFHPRDVGLTTYPLAAIQVDTVAASKAMILAAFEDRHPAARDVIAANAGAALYVSGVKPTLAEGIAHALQVIRNGQALAKLQALSKF